MDLETIQFTCRGCLTVETKAILHSLENDHVRELFMNCTAVQVDLDETNTPLQICSLCFGRCENWEAFRSRCQSNDEVVRRKCGYFAWDSDGDGADEEVEEKVSGGYKKENPDSHEIHYVIEDATGEEGPEAEEEPEAEDEEEVAQEMDPVKFEIETQEEYEAREAVPEEQKAGTSCNSDRTTVYVCEECGEYVKGLLAYRKHKFQHMVNIKKRFRHSDKIIDKVTNSFGPVIEDQDQLLVQSWTQRNRKRMRNSGEAYINNSAVKVEKKQVQPIDCSACFHKCNQNFTDAEREQIHREYWAKDYGAKRLFLHESVEEKRCLRQRQTNSRRQFTLEYTFLGKRVCKKFFVATLDITDKVVMHCKVKARHNEDVATDFRGTKGSRRGRRRCEGGNAEQKDSAK